MLTNLDFSCDKLFKQEYECSFDDKFMTYHDDYKFGNDKITISEFGGIGVMSSFPPNPSVGELIYKDDTQRLMTFDGSQWVFVQS